MYVYVEYYYIENVWLFAIPYPVNCSLFNKVSGFPVPSQEVTKLSLAGNNKIFPGQGEFGK
jgi:hypothetical protein